MTLAHDALVFVKVCVCVNLLKRSKTLYQHWMMYFFLLEKSWVGTLFLVVLMYMIYSCFIVLDLVSWGFFFFEYKTR